MRTSNLTARKSILKVVHIAFVSSLSPIRSIHSGQSCGLPSVVRFDTVGSVNMAIITRVKGVSTAPGYSWNDL